jgi:hypothetical protein
MAQQQLNDNNNSMMWGGLSASTNPGDYYAPPLTHQKSLEEMIRQGVGRANTAAPQLSTAPQDQFRRMQMQQAQQLQAVASGQQKGAGELAAERQAQNAYAAQQALAAMRGAGGAGQLAAARQSAAVGSTAAGMGRQAALQDQQAAQGMLGQVAQQARGQDLGLAGQNAQLTQQQHAQNQQGYQAMIQALMGMDQAQLQAQLASMQAANEKKGLIGPIASAAGSLGGAAMMSDERVKVDVVPAGDKVDQMLTALRPVHYSYRDEAKHGVGPRVGILAQDMDRSDLGRSAIRHVPDGMALDVNKAISLALAGNARLNERLAALESRDSSNIPSAMKTPISTLGGR